jgi:hypothetical protein
MHACLCVCTQLHYIHACGARTINPTPQLMHEVSVAAHCACLAARTVLGCCRLMYLPSMHQVLPMCCSQPQLAGVATCNCFHHATRYLRHVCVHCMQCELYEPQVVYVRFDGSGSCRGSLPGGTAAR